VVISKFGSIGDSIKNSSFAQNISGVALGLIALLLMAVIFVVVIKFVKNPWKKYYLAKVINSILWNPVIRAF